MVLGKLPVLWRSTIWIIVGQGPTALSVGESGVSGRRPDIDRNPQQPSTTSSKPK